MKRAAFILVICFILPTPAFGEKRFAKEGEGVQLNQRFAVMVDGTVYAEGQDKVIEADQYFTPKEIRENRRALEFYLLQKRYWHSGVPPRGTFLERHKKANRHKRETESLQGLVGQENWFQFEAPPLDEGG